MTVREITLHLDETPATARRTEGAITLAARFGAHLVGVIPEAPPALLGYLAVDSGAQLLDRWIAKARERTQEARAAFEARVEGRGIESSVCVVQGGHGEVMTFIGRASDLIIVAQADPDTPNLADGLADDLMMSAGRPVLVWPYVGEFATPGTRALVAWNGSREATRALHDAMPLLAAAEQVVVLTIAAEAGRARMAEDLVAALTRRGITAEAREMVARDGDAPELLLSATAEFLADLIVMGAWGHSRLREVMLGGATREVLDTMTAPTLFSH